MVIHSIDTVKEWEIGVMQSNIPVVVDFWAEWCGPCKIISPVIDELAKEYHNKVKFVKVNVDNAQEIASKFNISSIPVIAVIINGEIKEQSIGAASKATYEKLIKKALNS